MENPVRIPVPPQAEGIAPSETSSGAPEFELEGRLSDGATFAAVVCHPHPAYGGSMDVPVVQVMRDACAAAGAATLRFNFRGVGQSGGSYGNGTGEAEDVAAAVSFLREKGHSRIAVLGYSFGAWVIALARDRLGDLEQMIFVSPPIHLLDFRQVGPLPALSSVVIGDDDDWVSEAGLRPMLTDWNPDAELVILPYTGHFYSQSLGPLSDALTRLIAPSSRSK